MKIRNIWQAILGHSHRANLIKRLDEVSETVGALMEEKGFAPSDVCRALIVNPYAGDRCVVMLEVQVSSGSMGMVPLPYEVDSFNKRYLLEQDVIAVSDALGLVCVQQHSHTGEKNLTAINPFRYDIMGTPKQDPYDPVTIIVSKVNGIPVNLVGTEDEVRAAFGRSDEGRGVVRFEIPHEVEEKLISPEALPA